MGWLITEKGRKLMEAWEIRMGRFKIGPCYDEAIKVGYFHSMGAGLRVTYIHVCICTDT